MKVAPQTRVTASNAASALFFCDLDIFARLLSNTDELTASPMALLVAWSAL